MGILSLYGTLCFYQMTRKDISFCYAHLFILDLFFSFSQTIQNVDICLFDTLCFNQINRNGYDGFILDHTLLDPLLI